MKLVESAKTTIDNFQQKHAYVGFPVAVVKRYGDDKAGREASLIAYYAFLALFPLMMVFITVVSIVISNDPQLQARVSGEVFRYFPALGSRLEGSVHTLKGSGVPLILEILALLFGTRGLAVTLQESFNTVWHVEKEHRPSFIGDNLRSLSMVVAAGTVIIAGTLISYALGGILDFGIIGTVLIAVVNLAIISGLFFVVFRLGTSNRIKSHWLIPGALIAGFGQQIVQHFGVRIMSHQLPKLSDSYGTFALALGMMFWIYLQAQIILYALEITAVRAQKDWPKKLF